MHGDLVIIAGLIDRNGGKLALQFIATTTQRMVPNNFQAIIRNREGEAIIALCDAVAIGHQLADQRIIARGFIDEVWVRA